MTPPIARHSLATLFDKILDEHKLKNDAALARLLEKSPPVISKARRGTRIGSALMLRIHEAFDIPFVEIRAHMVEIPA